MCVSRAGAESAETGGHYKTLQSRAPRAQRRRRAARAPSRPCGAARRRGHRQKRGAVPGAEAQGEVLTQQPRSAQEAGMSPRSPRASGLLYMVG